MKQRMQLHQSQFRSVTTCARTVYQLEGFSAFYISYPTTLAISVPFNAIQVGLYDRLNRFLNPRREYSPSSHIVSGGIAGAVAAAITTPLDVAKTMLQTRGSSTDADIRNVKGMGDALRMIVQREGLKGLTRGLTARVLTNMPSSAICWMSYEFFSECSVNLCNGANAHLLSSSQKQPFGRRIITYLLTYLESHLFGRRLLKT